MTTPLTVSDAIAAMSELDQLDDIDRAAAARRLTESVPMVLSAHADAAVYAATREASRSTVASRLGVSVKAVESAITRHRKAAGGPG